MAKASGHYFLKCSLSFFVFFVFHLDLFSEPLSLQIHSESGILMNADTGVILFEKNAHEAAFPASITKVATALFVLKTHGNRLENSVTVKPEALASISPQNKRQSNYKSPAYWLETDGSHIGMKKGEEMSLRNLLYALLISSANDAANVIAQHAGGTIQKFMEKENAYLKELGCQHTHFLNPHGLHHPGHITTAYDMALIAKEAMKYPIFREIVSTARYTCPQTNLELERHFVQTNLLLRKGPYRYPRAIGIKTGTTRAAGKTLIAAAKEGDRTLIAVVLGSKDIKGRYDDVIQLFEAAFNQPKKRCHVLPKGVQSLSAAIAGSKSSLKTYLTEGLYYDFYPSEEPHIKVTVQWNALSLPIEKDQEVGRVKVVDASGKVLQVQQLFAAERIEPSTWYRVKSLFAKKTGMRKLVFFIGIGVIVTYLVLLRSKKRQRSRRMY